MIELTQEQREALRQNGAEPVRAIDPIKAEYVLMPAEVYERLKASQGDDVAHAAALRDKGTTDDDAKGPPLDVSARPQDEWERRLLGAASDCGVFLPDSAVSSEGLYE